MDRIGHPIRLTKGVSRTRRLTRVKSGNADLP